MLGQRALRHGQGLLAPLRFGQQLADVPGTQERAGQQGKGDQRFQHDMRRDPAFGDIANRIADEEHGGNRLNHDNDRDQRGLPVAVQMQPLAVFRHASFLSAPAIATGDHCANDLAARPARFKDNPGQVQCNQDIEQVDRDLVHFFE